MRTEVIWQAWREVGLLPHQVLIWKKTRAVLTYRHYLWDYEPMMYGWPAGHVPALKPPADVDARSGRSHSRIEDGAAGMHPTAEAGRDASAGRSSTTPGPAACSTSPSRVRARR